MDLQHADCILIEGSNMAECHPVAFRWIMEAKRRGATIIHVDPRYTRTSAVSDLHVPIRAGTDIAFLGGIVHYILENDRWFHDYVLNYTNASAILEDGFRDTEDLDGLFSGYDPEHNQYDVSTWGYKDVGVVPAAGHKEVFPKHAGQDETRPRGKRITYIHHDPTLQDPRCVFQVLKRHFSRYTGEMVERICGVPGEVLRRVAEALCVNSGRERTSAFVYAVGWTQHTVGVQNIRAASIVQLLLGNIGRRGGGIMALRGHASIQGSTDIPTLFDLLPGYLPMPRDNGEATDLKTYIESNESGTAWWSQFPKYIVSLLKAYYGEHATKDNDFGFDLLPKLSGNHSHMNTVADMADGKLDGYFVMGENPAVGSANGALQRKALRKLKWLVVLDLGPTETSEFWRTAPEIARGDVRPEDIATEVFFFPAAAHTEKDGSFTNTQRLLQWHHKAVEPKGAARSDLWFVYHLGRRLKAMYESSTDPRDLPIRSLTWDYPVEGPLREPSAEAVLREINGYTIADGKPVPGFTDLSDDGSTACGCWIYSGCYANGINQTARRTPRVEQNWLGPEWGWAWPSNRRVMYNRASADPDGKPWSERKSLVWWDAEKRQWTGHDVPDFIKDRDPAYRPEKGAQGIDAIAGNEPFIMESDGVGWLFAPSGLLDGPLPTHYEPQESIVPNALYGQQCNPIRVEWARPENPYHAAWNDPRFPFPLTTFRLTEHHTAGGMSRWLSWLAEMQPEMFCEVSPELAAERGLENGGWATITTARAEIECRVLVTERIRPLVVGGRTIHQIGLPYHWGVVGRVIGDSVNDLLPMVADPNVNIQESKAMTGNIVAGRRSRGRRAATGFVVPPAPGAEPARDLPIVGSHAPKSQLTGKKE